MTAAQDDQSRHGTRAMKRRGLIAGAAVLVAGIVAKQTSSPVAAVTEDNAYVATGGYDLGYDFNAAGTNSVGFVTTGTFTVGVHGFGSDSGVWGESPNGMGVNAHSDSSYGVYATSSATTLGGAPAIFGTNTSGDNGIGVIGVVTSGIGLKGDANGGNGVFGLARTGGVAKGVYGKHLTNGYGVYGEATTGSLAIGVQGVVTNGDATARGVSGNSGGYGYGVYGTNTNGTGVHGVTTGGYGVQGIGGAIGVRGDSGSGTGVYGVTNASYNYGVLGTTTAANSTAIAGACTQNGSSAFSGGTTNPNAFAAFFQGTTVVQGNFAVTGNKSAALAHPDGSHRLVYCVESPESWIEDVGTGILTNGKATVTFDKDFTSVVHTDAYHVFLTEYDDNNALYVTKKTPTGFAVHAKNNASANGLFSWRVMVKRSDMKAERLGKFVMPTLPLPDPSKFKVPETPAAAVPKKP